MESETHKPRPQSAAARGRIGFAVGLLALGLTLVLPAPEGMPPEAFRVAGLVALMAIWWISEPIPIPATALIPLVALPLLGVASGREAAAPYADPVVFLFLGGFVLGFGMQISGLHRRIGISVVAMAGASPTLLLGGFLFATAFLSMWVNNTATTAMMLPVALSVIAYLGEGRARGEEGFGGLDTSLVLATAYAASIGGLGTLIGSTPNAFLAGYMARAHGIEIGFAQWMAIGVPVVVLMIIATWLILARLFPAPATLGAGAAEAIAGQRDALGPITQPEFRAAAIVLATACAWIARPAIETYAAAITDTTIAIAGALLMFLVPSGRGDGRGILVWEDLRDLPWGVLLLFGGGLSLAFAIGESGLAAWLGSQMQALSAWPVLALVAAATLGMLLATELMSNTAASAIFIPIGGAVAVSLALDPALLCVPLAMAATCAFMLPVGTPPNAIVYGSGRVTIGQMAWAGMWLNLVGTAIIVAATMLFAGRLFG
jgi:sodium-dependent dicarboxylate transporter 2/3/5